RPRPDVRRQHRQPRLSDDHGSDVDLYGHACRIQPDQRRRGAAARSAPQRFLNRRKRRERRHSSLSPSVSFVLSCLKLLESESPPCHSMPIRFGLEARVMHLSHRLIPLVILAALYWIDPGAARAQDKQLDPKGDNGGSTPFVDSTDSDLTIAGHGNKL